MVNPTHSQKTPAKDSPQAMQEGEEIKAKLFSLLRERELNFIAERITDRGIVYRVFRGQPS